MSGPGDLVVEVDLNAAYQETIENDPTFAAAFKRAEEGTFDHTLFEMFEHKLDEGIANMEKKASMNFCDAIMRGFPWLDFAGVDLYRHVHAERLKEIKSVMQALYPKPAKFLFKENVADWEKHKKAYIQLYISWTLMVQDWAVSWAELPADSRFKGAEMASITVATAMVIGKDGMLEDLRGLNGWELTPEDKAVIDEGIAAGLSDE